MLGFRFDLRRHRQRRRILVHLGQGASWDQVSIFYIFTQEDVGKDPKLPVSPGNPLDHRQPTNTSGPALELERLANAHKLTNISVVGETKASTLSHNEVPRTHLANLLKAAAYLDDR